MALFSKNTTTSIDPEQKELIENAQARMRQKKQLYRHFVFFLAGAILLIVLNLALGVGQDFKILNIDWFVWAILLWSFFFLVHVINVVFMGSFMNKEWEKRQLDKLVTKQKLKIAELEEVVEQKYPVSEKKKTTITSPELPLPDQHSPQ